MWLTATPSSNLWLTQQRGAWSSSQPHRRSPQLAGRCGGACPQWAWGTDPNAFLRSRKVTKIDKPLALAFSSREFRANVCSITPLTPLIKPFWVDVSMMFLVIRYLSRRLAMILWNTFPMQLVSAIGLKFAGSDWSPAL